MTLNDKVARRFWAKVETRSADECWPWLGELKWPARAVAGTSMKGCYGAFYIISEDGKKRRHNAHRIAWALTHGDAPPDKFVCHSCDDPRCCNPAHLWLGTAGENNRDRHAKGRSRGGMTSNRKQPRADWKESPTWAQRDERRRTAPRGVRQSYAEQMRQCNAWAEDAGE